MQHYSDELFLLGNQGGSWMLQGRPLNFNEADFVHLPSSLCLLIAFIFDPVHNGQIFYEDFQIKYMPSPLLLFLAVSLVLDDSKHHNLFFSLPGQSCS